MTDLASTTSMRGGAAAEVWGLRRFYARPVQGPAEQLATFESRFDGQILRKSGVIPRTRRQESRMSKLRQLFARLTHKDGRGEDDVVGDPARVDARSDGGVGRVAADDDFTGPTGADRRGGDESEPH